jgi:hypothetical protein
MSKQVKREIRYGGKPNTHYGNIGEPTRITYKDGSIAHVGDLVDIYENHGYEKRYLSESMIVRKKDSEPFVMGLYGYKDTFKNGVSRNFTIELVKKYYDVEDGYYRGGILKVITHKKQTEQKKKTSQITVKVKADLLFDKPVVEENKGDVYIFSGRSVIYINNEFGMWGMATCNSNELKSYSKDIGKALAYYRANNREE